MKEKHFVYGLCNMLKHIKWWEMYLFKHNGNSLLWNVTHCTIHNKYFIHCSLSFVFGECMHPFIRQSLSFSSPATESWESETQQVFFSRWSSHVRLTSQFRANLRGFVAEPRLHWSYLGATDMIIPGEQKSTNGDTRGSPQTRWSRFSKI